MLYRLYSLGSKKNTTNKVYIVLVSPIDIRLKLTLLLTMADLNFGLAVKVSVNGDIMIMVPHGKIDSFPVPKMSKDEETMQRYSA